VDEQTIINMIPCAYVRFPGSYHADDLGMPTKISLYEECASTFSVYLEWRGGKGHG
jgi:hypothetical protein